MIIPIRKLDAITKENEELIAILSKSIDTARKNRKSEH
jgi:hypothetical protein